MDETFTDLLLESPFYADRSAAIVEIVLSLEGTRLWRRNTIP